MIKKLLTRAVTPFPSRGLMGVVVALIIFTMGFTIGGNAVVSDTSADLSAELLAAITEDKSQALAEKTGPRKVALRALYDGAIIPLVKISAYIAESGYSAGTYVAVTFGIAVAELIANALAWASIAITGYEIVTDVRQAKVGA